MIALIFLSLLSPSSGRANADGTVAEAENEYRAGLEARHDSRRARTHFAKAAEAYEKAWAAGRRTPEVARNLAQANYLVGDLGRCIRDYRRGLKLSPHDRELRRGLAFAREQVAYPLTGDLEKSARPRDIESFVERLGISFTWLILLGVMLWAVAWFLLARGWMTRRTGLTALGIGGLLLATTLGGWLAWEDQQLRRHYSEPSAVVTSPSELRLGNSDEYPRRIESRLPAGIEVRILGERGGWLHVELADGTAGWLPREHLAPVD